MPLIEFLLTAISVLLFSLLMSCVWNRLKAKSRSKSESKPNYDSDHTVDQPVNNGTSAQNGQTVSTEIVVTSLSGQDAEDEQASQVLLRVDQDSSNDIDDGFDQMNKSHQRLEHINKSRPKRSQIRRSTRKSKIESNSNLFTAESNESHEDMDQSDAKPTISLEDLPNRLSMFSLRIEEVTQPLATTHRPQSSNDNYGQEAMR